MNYPEKLFYTKDHEWISFEGDTGLIGITDFAQKELGDIVYLDVNTLKEIIEGEKVFGTIEAVKTVSDLFMPLKGEVLEINQKVIDAPQLINTDPYGEGWLIKIKVITQSEKENLLTANEYKKLIGA
ncbi:glycine cleavage system protein GcvH [Aurantibacillus circumpalustris]|uniref:glycine cleavage system protein GcvH n=1 Tax=Aurantibacillus circumpalustris TaxID=3036359 RepID=UPI00295C1FBC|nr:glycine cleavage system protein GcvH [Aurantibacillus circumpalustris]